MSLVIDERLTLPEQEIQLTAVRAQGAGGQNANKPASAAHLRCDLPAASLPEALQERLLALRDGRISRDGVVVIKAQQYRTQEQNRADALERLATLIATANVQEKPRRPTQPPYGSKQRRLEGKSRRSGLKASRGRVDF